MQQFEGPLDLLLHLIEEQELDIYEVRLSLVTEQYLQYIYEARNLNLDLASEFLIMAARLLQMKVRRLLPSQQGEEEEELEQLEEDLFKQLAEYKLYKDLVGMLKEKHESFSRFIFRDSDEEEIIKEFITDHPLENCSLDDLARAFRNILVDREKPEPVIEIMRESYSLTDVIREVHGVLRNAREPVRFTALFPVKATREKVIITFLALLELIRNRQARFVQNQTFSEIYILPVGNEGMPVAFS